MKDSTLIASPILEVLSQIEIKLNWLPMTPFSVYMHGMCLTFGKPFIRKPLTPRIFSINSLKSVEVLIGYNSSPLIILSLPIPNEQTLVTRYVLFHIIKFFLIWIFDSSFGHTHNYTPAACCCVTGTSEIFILSSFLVWWLPFTIGLTTYLIAMVTQLQWQKYDT